MLHLILTYIIEETFLENRAILVRADLTLSNPFPYRILSRFLSHEMLERTVHEKHSSEKHSSVYRSVV